MTVLNQVVGIPFHDLVEALCDRGVTLTVLSGRDLPPHLAGRAEITFLKGPPYRRDSLVSRGRSWLAFSAWALGQLLLRRPPGPVVIVSNPPTALWLAVPLHHLLGREVLLIVYDVYPDAFVTLGHLGSAHPAVYAWRLANRLAFAASRHVVTLGRTMAARLARQAPEVSERLVVLESWADVERLVPVPRAENRFAQAHGLDGTLNVMYSGNLGATRSLDLLLASARRLRDVPGIRLVVVGEGSEARSIEARVRTEGLDNVLVLPFQPDDVFPQSQAAADLAVIPLDPRCDGIAVPSKLYSALATGAAVLAISSGTDEVAQTVRRFDCGVHVAPDDEDGFVAAILRYHADPALLARAQANARRAAVEHFSREVIVSRYNALIDDMLAAGCRGARTAGGRHA